MMNISWPSPPFSMMRVLAGKADTITDFAKVDSWSSVRGGGSGSGLGGDGLVVRSSRRDEWHDDEAEYDEHAAEDDDVGRRDAMTSEESPAATRWESAEAAPGAQPPCEVQSERRRNHEASYVLPSLRQRTLDSFVVPAGGGSGGSSCA